MKISAFTIVKNAHKLYFPIEESIKSILPIVDEYIVAIDIGDINDISLEIINNINSPKIRVIERQWKEEQFINSEVLSYETNYAMGQCTGDWCFYLQADEVIHDKDHKNILTALEKSHNHDDIDGLLFNYLHFWGDYNHYLPFHGWYKHEIRIVRNTHNIRSHKDAQSFRYQDGKKLKVIQSNANIYHYGWVRPPMIMQAKKKIHDGFHIGKDNAELNYAGHPSNYDYGPLGKLPTFEGKHPNVMKHRIGQMSWKSSLNYSKKWIPNRPLNKHEKWHYRILSQFEKYLLGGREIFGYSNWKLKK